MNGSIPLYKSGSIWDYESIFFFHIYRLLFVGVPMVPPQTPLLARPKICQMFREPTTSSVPSLPPPPPLGISSSTYCGDTNQPLPYSDLFLVNLSPSQPSLYTCNNSYSLSCSCLPLPSHSLSTLAITLTPSCSCLPLPSPSHHLSSLAITLTLFLALVYLYLLPPTISLLLQ